MSVKQGQGHVTSQLPIDQWHDNLGEPTLADAICDRLVHTGIRLELSGESRRKPAADTSTTTTGGAPPANTQ